MPWYGLCVHEGVGYDWGIYYLGMAKKHGHLLITLKAQDGAHTHTHTHTLIILQTQQEIL